MSHYHKPVYQEKSIAGGRRKKHFSQEFKRILRSISSAFIFGASLLYTMEIWWIGMYAPIWKIIIFWVFAFLINIFIGYFAGFLDVERGFWHVAFRAIEAFAIGLIAALISLYVLNRIEYTESFRTALGKTMTVIIPFSIGAFLTDVIFPFMTSRKKEEQQESSSWRETLSDIGATIAGGIFVGFPIAPTEEIQELAAEMTYWHELATIILALLLSYMIVFASAENQQERERINSSSFLQQPLIETALAYSVSIIFSFLLLFLFDQIHPLQDSIYFMMSQTVILALPVTIGGAAGRLAV